jgi:hypothetical protein
MLYEDCKTRLNPENNQENQQITYGQMKFDKKNLVFISGRCSNHAMRALDNLNTFENTFSLKQIKGYLNPYGRAILLDAGNH